MDLKQLSYFVSVADHKSFNRAGAKLRMTQPALSRQVRALETELGVQLFRRHGRGVALTEEGAVLRERAQGILQHVEAVRGELSERAARPSGELVVALPAAFRDLVTPALLSNFHQHYPTVSLRVMEQTSVDREEGVANGVADLAVVTARESEGGLLSRPLLSESVLLVGAADCGLQMSSKVDLAELPALSIVQNSRPNGVRMLIERAMARKGLALRTAIEVDSVPLLVNLAARGRHFACVPYSAVHEDLRAGRVAAAPLHGVNVTWKLLSATVRPLSLAGRLFEDMLRSHCDKLVKAKAWRTGRLVGAVAAQR